VEVTNCFAVPHAERGDEVAIGKDFNKTMVQLHRKTNRKEVVVGWYATTISGESNTTTTTTATSSLLVADNSSLIHDFYATEADDGEPIHIVVDTRLIVDAIPIRGYISTPILIQNEPMANLFHEIQVQVQSSEAEAICLHEMKRQLTTTQNTENITTTAHHSSFTSSLQQLLSSLDSTLAYVDGVVQQTIPANPTLGRELSKIVAQLPRSKNPTLVHDQQLQDLLLVTHLSQLTKLQLDVAEQLHTTLLG
jgi:translation initiation factor 3 subunit F